MRVDFPDGQWAEIHSVGEMPRRVTVRMQEMLAAAPEEASGYATFREIELMRDTMIAMLVKQWGYETKRTGSPEDLYDLPQASYDALVEATREHWKKTGFTGALAQTEETPETPETTETTPETKPASSTSSA